MVYLRSSLALHLGFPMKNFNHTKEFMGFILPNFEAVEKKTTGSDATLSKTPFSQNIKLVPGFYTT